MLTLIDNFDSFTYNIVHAFEKMGYPISVVRNDVSIEHCLATQPKALILGPGPGGPQESGICGQLVGNLPLLGVCLGHQLLGYHFGAAVVPNHPHHGKCSSIFHSGQGLFEGLPQGFLAARYHSLIIERDTLPDSLEITAWTEEGEVMGIAHRELPFFGVQFHPDSIATEYGLDIFKNFVTILSRIRGSL